MGPRPAQLFKDQRFGNDRELESVPYHLSHNMSIISVPVLGKNVEYKDELSLCQDLWPFWQNIQQTGLPNGKHSKPKQKLSLVVASCLFYISLLDVTF